MPAHAILITYRDLEYQNTELVSKATSKYASFKQLYFDSGYQLSLSLRYVVDRIPKKDRLKIFISGHGGTGVQYITANDGVRKQTVGDLAALLESALGARAASRGASDNTEVNMFSCSFGLTPDGGLDGIPAVRLHRMLAAKGVYVDLVARTEWLAAKPRGRVTMSPLHRKIDTLEYNKYLEMSKDDDVGEHYAEKVNQMYPIVERWKRPKTQFTKIRCTFLEADGSPVVGIRDWKGQEGPYINSMDLQGRRILWADNVINQLVEYITPPDGQTEVTDERHKKLYETVKYYDEERDPVRLEGRLGRLKTDFSTHRKTFHWPGSTPKTAGVITKLLDEYPRS
jgi:hypothetical protein